MRLQTSESYKKRVLRVLVHLQQNLDEVLPLEELARVAHFSPYHFHRVFRSMAGESVMEHIRRLRLERALSHLVFTTRPITQIAFDAGYETHEGFTRAFRAMFGKSPSEMRKEARDELYANAPSSVHYRADGNLEDFEPVEWKDTPVDVRIQTIEPMTVAFMRHLGPYDRCGETWGKLLAWAGRRGLLNPQTVTVGIAYDSPEITPADKVRYDACITVDEDFAAEGEIGVQRIAGGEYAVATHQGSYKSTPCTIEMLYRWLPTSGREPRHEPLLLFYRDHLERISPEKRVTDICLPLQARNRSQRFRT